MLQSGGKNCKLWYNLLRTKRYKFSGVCDAAFKNILAKYSLTGYVIMLCEDEPGVPEHGRRGPGCESKRTLRRP